MIPADACAPEPARHCCRRDRGINSWLTDRCAPRPMPPLRAWQIDALGAIRATLVCADPDGMCA